MTRFVDVIWSRYGDERAAFNENDHPRDESGKFAKAAGEGSSEEKDLSNALRGKPIEDYIKALRSEIPGKIVLAFIRNEMQGKSVRCNVKGVGPTDVSFGSNFARETSNKIKNQHPENRVKVARQILVTLEHVAEVMKSGAKSEWEESFKEGKHKRETFARCFKRLYDPKTGEPFVAVVALKRLAKQAPVPYLTTVKGTRGYREMFNRQRFARQRVGDNALYEVSVEYVYIKN